MLKIRDRIYDRELILEPPPPRELITIQGHTLENEISGDTLSTILSYIRRDAEMDTVIELETDTNTYRLYTVKIEIIDTIKAPYKQELTPQDVQDAIKTLVNNYDNRNEIVKLVHNLAEKTKDITFIVFMAGIIDSEPTYSVYAYLRTKAPPFKYCTHGNKYETEIQILKKSPVILIGHIGLSRKDNSHVNIHAELFKSKKLRKIL